VQQASHDEPFAFLSHARTDRAYVGQLASFLTEAGVPNWYDRELHAGQRWPETIQARITTSAAVIVVVSDACKASEWVERELLLAEQLRKPIFPLQLEGERWWRLSDIQTVEIDHRRMPGCAFVDQIKALVLDTARVDPPALPPATMEIARLLESGDIDGADRLAAETISAAAGGSPITLSVTARRLSSDLLRLLAWMYRSVGGLELRDRPFVMEDAWENEVGLSVADPLTGRTFLEARLDELDNEDGGADRHYAGAYPG
jgi:hypothetical protein